MNGTRRLRALTLSALLAALLVLGTAPLAAQTPPTLTHSYTFGQTATFILNAPADLEAAEAILYLRIGGDHELRSQAHTVPIEDGVATYRRDLREAPFPPFAQITYWWEAGAFKTDPQDFLYEDNRFEWKTLSANAITLHWVTGDEATMVSGLDITQTALEEIQRALQVPPPDGDDGIRVYVYPSLPDLQSALRLAGREWIGAEALPEVGVLLINLPASQEATLRMKRLIPHELTHKMIYDQVGPQGYDAIPTWLMEGLASYVEQSPDPAYSLALQDANEQGDLIDLATLCYPFPAERDRALLAYAQSQSLVAYIQQTYGWSRIRALLDAYADGLDCGAGVQQVLEMDLHSLQRAWQAWLTQRETPSAWAATLVVLLRELAPWVMLLLVISLPSLAVLVNARLRP